MKSSNEINQAKNSTSNPFVRQCPTDQFRFKLGIKASAGDWVMERRSNSTAWPYKECEAQRNSPNWANGIVPQTEACYRTAVDFTTLSNYQFDMRAAGVRPSSAIHPIEDEPISYHPEKQRFQTVHKPI